MAILKGIISKLNGSAGDLTFKQLGGKTVVSEKLGIYAVPDLRQCPAH